MTEQSRIITEEQWQEYMKLKEQVFDANQIIGSYADCANWNHNGNFVDYDTDLENDRLALAYLNAWGIK